MSTGVRVRSLLVRGLAGMLSGIVAVLLGMDQAQQAWTLHQGATMDETRMVRVLGTRVGDSGWGPWRTEVVEIPVGTDATQVRVPPLPPEVDGGEYHPVLIHGMPVEAARFAGTPPAVTAWIPFAVVAAVLVLAGVGLVAVSRRPLGQAVFSQRDPHAEDVGWVPGGGSHGGGGGQVPPYVPYRRDWDPDNR